MQRASVEMDGQNAYILCLPLAICDRTNEIFICDMLNHSVQ